MKITKDKYFALAAKARIELEKHSRFAFSFFVTILFSLVFCGYGYNDFMISFHKYPDYLEICSIILKAFSQSLITYTLVCAIQNIIEIILEKGNRHFLINFLLLIFNVIYVSIYNFYVQDITSIFWMVIMILFTILLFSLNLFAYIEVYKGSHREHGFV